MFENISRSLKVFLSPQTTISDTTDIKLYTLVIKSGLSKIGRMSTMILLKLFDSELVDRRQVIRILRHTIARVVLGRGIHEIAPNVGERSRTRDLERAIIPVRLLSWCTLVGFSLQSAYESKSVVVDISQHQPSS